MRKLLAVLLVFGSASTAARFEPWPFYFRRLVKAEPGARQPIWASAPWQNTDLPQ
jgi:hypothetical protein